MTDVPRQPEALRLADALRALHEFKKYYPSGPGGQMCGSEQYRLVASGLAFEDLQNAAAELRRLHEAHEWQYTMAGERLRRIEKLEAKLKQEKTSRQAAQIENEELKYRLARSGVEQRRAILAERESCAELMEQLHTWITNAAANAIRARTAPRVDQDIGDIVVTWNHDRTKILAVTRQDKEGKILKVIAEAP